MTDYKETPEKEDVEQNRRKRKKRKQKEQEKKKSLREELIEDIFLALAVLVSVFVMKHFLLINAEIPSGSMENTIMTGDRMFGNRLAYLISEPERGDIVIFKFPDNRKDIYIKRLIGLPGDEITIRDGAVYLNGSKEPLEEPYLHEKTNGEFGPYVVPEGHYFMMGDNRNHSNDSRFWENTCVPREDIMAKAFVRYYPFDKIGMIK